MSDFFTRLATHVLQPQMSITPAIPSRFSPGVDVPGSAVPTEPPPLETLSPHAPAALTGPGEGIQLPRTTVHPPVSPQPLVAETIAPGTEVPGLQRLLRLPAAEKEPPAADEESSEAMATPGPTSKAPETKILALQVPVLTESNDLVLEAGEPSSVLPETRPNPSLVRNASQSPQPEAGIIPTAEAPSARPPAIRESPAEQRTFKRTEAETAGTTSVDADPTIAPGLGKHRPQHEYPDPPEIEAPQQRTAAKSGIAPSARTIQPERGQTIQSFTSSSQPEPPAVTEHPAADMAIVPQVTPSMATRANASSEPDPGRPYPNPATLPANEKATLPSPINPTQAPAETAVSSALHQPVPGQEAAVAAPALHPVNYSHPRSQVEQTPGFSAAPLPASNPEKKAQQHLHAPEIEPKSIIRPVLRADFIPGEASRSATAGEIEPAETIVRITISRIVVRAAPPPAPAAPKPVAARRQPAVSLSEYLARHRTGG